MLEGPEQQDGGVPAGEKSIGQKHLDIIREILAGTSKPKPNAMEILKVARVNATLQISGSTQQNSGTTPASKTHQGNVPKWMENEARARARRYIGTGIDSEIDSEENSEEKDEY